MTRLFVCQLRTEVAGLRVDDDGLRVVALARQGIAGQLLEGDLLRPTDADDAVDGRAGRRARDRGRDLVGRDRLDQRIGDAHLVADGHGLRDLVGELGELRGVHDRVGEAGLAR